MARFDRNHWHCPSEIPTLQAIQVTDRWHLLKNLGEAVQKILVKQYSKANTVLAGKHLGDEVPKPVAIHPGRGESKSPDQSAHGGIRLQRFRQLKELQRKGYSIRALARHLGMSRKTVKSYLDKETLPRTSQRRVNPLESFFPYIKKRMEEEPDIFLTTLWKGLKSQGYNGAYTTLSEALMYYGIRVGKKARLTKKLPTRSGASFKPSTAAIWFVSDQAKLGETQRKLVGDLCTASEDLQKTFTLAQSFRNMMTTRSGDMELRGWIDQSTKSNIRNWYLLPEDFRRTIRPLKTRWPYREVMAP